MEEEHKAIASEGLSLLQDAHNKFSSAGHSMFSNILSVLEVVLAFGKTMIEASNK
jgi:hypothetical protein